MRTSLKYLHAIKYATLVFAGLYLAAQLILPRLHLSYILNFDTSCYLHPLGVIEKFSPSGSCSAGLRSVFGFPFIIQLSLISQRRQQLITFLIDMLPVFIALAAYSGVKRLDESEKSSSSGAETEA